MAPAIVKAYNKTELANMYGVTVRALNRMLAKVPELELKPGKQLFAPKQVGSIFNHLGQPESEFSEK